MDNKLSLIMDEIKKCDNLIEEFQDCNEFFEDDTLTSNFISIKVLSIRFMEKRKSMYKTTYLLVKANFENTLTERYQNILLNRYRQLITDIMEDYEDLVQNELIDEGMFLKECDELRNDYNFIEMKLN